MNKPPKVQSVGLYVGSTNKASEVAVVTQLAAAEVGLAITDNDPGVWLVIGGDGTMLEAVHHLSFSDIPLAGVRAGSLNFLSEVGPDNMAAFLGSLVKSDYIIEHLPLLSLQSDKTTYYAFNDIIIERASSKAAHLRVVINDHTFERFVGDGLIFSTPQGSTAYAVAAGGAIVAPSLPSFQLTPTNSHDSIMFSSLRSSVVMPQATKVQVGGHDNTYRPFRVVIDGKELIVEEPLIITLARKTVPMIRTLKYDYFAHLAEKVLHSS